MSENIVIIGLVVFFIWVWKSKDSEGKVKIPPWVSKLILLGLIVMLVRNSKDVLHVLFTEGDAWWPIIKGHVQNLLGGLRSFVAKLGDG
ncbi:hypothetical protein [Paenibacillus sp. y28]|uniref:hypothetical protein n=1 Tax=Paenibacillus sp. y28 TaxID=3129110 RepID=UPI003016E430